MSVETRFSALIFLFVISYHEWLVSNGLRSYRKLIMRKIRVSLCYNQIRCSKHSKDELALSRSLKVLYLLKKPVISLPIHASTDKFILWIPATICKSKQAATSKFVALTFISISFLNFFRRLFL